MHFVNLWTLAGFAAAVFRDDAGVVDGKDVFLGQPLAVSQYNNSIAMVSDAGIVSVLDDSGHMKWRQSLSTHQLQAVGIYAGIVAVGGGHLSIYSASNGTLLHTINHPSTSIASDSSGIYIDNEFILSSSGELIQVKGAPAKPVKIENRKAQLPNGTLSWGENAVLTYTDTNGDVKYVRDDGLAHVKQAIFVRPLIDSEEALADELGAQTSQAAETSGVVSLIAAWSQRVSTHLSQLYALGRLLLTSGPALLVLPELPKAQFELDQTLVLLTENGSLYGVNTTTKEVSWVYHDLHAEKIKQHDADTSQFIVVKSDKNAFLMTYDGEFVGTVPTPAPTHFESLEVQGATLVSSLGWSVELPGEEVVGKAARDPKDRTASVVVPLDGNGSVLYKYLNPYAAAFASYSSASRELAVTIIDSLTGRILSQHIHPEPVVINSEWPLQIVFGEYWVVYTYLSLDASETEKVTVIELYESETPNERLTSKRVNGLSDTLVPHTKTRSWISPFGYEPVYALGLSKSKFGASAREILFSVENRIVSIPKVVLSTMRSPSSILEVPQSGHVSHIFGVSRSKLIVTGETNLESTYLVAALDGPDMFISMVTPSGEFDRLTKSFPKVKLILFIVFLGFAVFTMSPLARSKKLQQQWR